eukprot:CAMPEP_0185732626 /NCGR_PEP_ID=MMETSP1171-20130828/16907_1 /TAXON_ID=374046 /ORGANISM="Helicotheca tamensis, Strain CCMP826" /LENGTH=682 /DNA_ID=CAMNT_0028402161 /DNA_START=52 /DNA_END=2100 /DNA_ORIENTATION=+
MLRKGASGAAGGTTARPEEDTISIESSERNGHFPNGETLVIPVGGGDNNNSNASQQGSYSQVPPSNPPPPHYGAHPPPPPPPPHGHPHYNHPNAPPPQPCLGGYYYNQQPSNNNSINFKVVVVAVLSLMAVLHLTRPQTAIIHIDPTTGAVLRHAVDNTQSNQGMYALGNKNSGMFGMTGSAGVVQPQQEQQEVALSTSQMMGGSTTSSSSSSSSYTSNAVPSTTTTGQTSSLSYGADAGAGSTSTTMMVTESMEEAAVASENVEGGEEGGTFEETMVEGGEDAASLGSYGETTTASLGSYGETTTAEQEASTFGDVPPEGVEGGEGTVLVEGMVLEDGRLPGTLPGTGEIDLSLSTLDNFKDAWDPYEPSDNAVFWHIPKAGGSTVKDVIGTCHRFVMATEFGITDGHENDPEIAVVYPGGGPVGQDRSPFVNVDTTTVEGIERAKQMGFADSGLADAIVTPFIYEANELFTPTAKGRLFTVFRHPIDRAISLFYYIQVADWEPTYNPDLVNWSIEEYAASDIIENNWMTRQLTNQLEGDLTDDHLALAMEVIRRKFLVGLMTQIERTVERFERFFRWTYRVNPPNQEACRERLLDGGSNKNASGNKKEKPQEGSEAYELLRMQNVYDLQLFEYIESLFEEQAEFVQDIPADFRNIDATCCKCFPPTFPPEGFDCPLAILN